MEMNRLTQKSQEALHDAQTAAYVARGLRESAIIGLGVLALVWGGTRLRSKKRLQNANSDSLHCSCPEVRLTRCFRLARAFAGTLRTPRKHGRVRQPASAEPSTSRSERGARPVMSDTAVETNPWYPRRWATPSAWRTTRLAWDLARRRPVRQKPELGACRVAVLDAQGAGALSCRRL